MRRRLTFPQLTTAIGPGGQTTAGFPSARLPVELLDAGGGGSNPGPYDILYVTALGTPSTNEAEHIARLEANGHTVTSQDDSTAAPGSGYDVVIIGNNAASADSHWTPTQADTFPMLWLQAARLQSAGFTTGAPGSDAGETSVIYRHAGGLAWTGQTEGSTVAISGTAGAIPTVQGRYMPKRSVPHLTTAAFPWRDYNGFIIPPSVRLSTGVTNGSNPVGVLALPVGFLSDAQATAALDQLIEDYLVLLVNGYTAAIGNQGTARSVGLVVRSHTGGTPDDPEDAELKAVLEDYGHTVTAINDSDAEVTSGHDVIVSAPDAVHSDTIYRGTGLPVVFMEGSETFDKSLAAGAETFTGTDYARVQTGAGALFTHWDDGDDIPMDASMYRVSNANTLADADQLLRSDASLSDGPIAWKLDVGSTLDDSTTTTAKVAVFGFSADFDLERVGPFGWQVLDDLIQWAAT